MRIVFFFLFYSSESVYYCFLFQKNRALSLVSNGLEIFLILVFLIALLLTRITTNWVILTNYVNAKTILYQKTCIGKNKGADQLCSNCIADQCLCFCYTKIVQTEKYIIKISSTHIQHFKLLALFCDYAGRFVSDIVGTPNCCFYSRKAQIYLIP